MRQVGLNRLALRRLGDPAGVETIPAVAAVFSEEVDLTVTSVGNVLVPAREGYVWVPLRNAVMFTAAAGTAATSNLAWKAGNNGAHDNVIASSNQSPAQVNAIVGATPFSIAATGPVSVALIDLLTPVTVEITSVPAGMTVFRARYIALGCYVPV